MPVAPSMSRLIAVLTAVLLATGLLVASMPAAQAAESAIEVGSLQTNARTTPLGIPGTDPTFGWTSRSAARGVTQSAYQVEVGTSAGADDMWSSGKVESAEQVDVKYAGDDLDSQQRYFWRVKVWDGDGNESGWSEPSWFETGVLTPGEWTGDWIGEADSIASWTNYTADVDFTLDNLALGVYLRAKGTDNGYMWQISTTDGTNVPKLRPHKKVNGGYSVLSTVPITTMTVAQLKTGRHRLSFTVDGSTITTRLDGTQIDQRNDTTFPQGFIGFRTDQAANEQATVHRVKVTTKTGQQLLDTDFSDGVNPFGAGQIVSGGLKISGGTDTLHIPRRAKPLLRKEFTAEPGKTIERARLYASARGVYEVQLNGDKVGDEHLAPGDTDYNVRIQSQAYDVTDQINSGANAIGVTLGDGWYAGHNANLAPGFYGSDLAFIGQLRVDYTDGSSQVVKTDNSWKTHAGPYVEADNLKGESYDARSEQPGYDQPNFDDVAWSPAAAQASTTSKIVPQLDQPVRTTEELPAKSRSHSGGDTYVYDLGQNMVGVGRVRLQGVAGQKVTLRHGEVVNPDGTLYTANLKTATATDHYTFKTTGTVVYEPSFTFHGFRYIEVSGATTAPDLADVSGQVFGSDLPTTGSFRSSNEMLNQLQSNITWGQRGNFLSIPTDTPARDERLGWSGDINVFAPTASYISDTRPFLAKWMRDLRDTQRANGSTPGAAPTFPSQGVGSGTGWEDAMITVPYAVWSAHGDKDIVRENYAAMEKFFGYVRTSAGGNLVTASREQYGDWLNLDDGTSQSVLSTAYYAEDARMLSEMAKALGEDADAAEYAALSDDIREAFAEQLVAADGTVTSNSQTAYAMALGMNLVTDEGQRAKVGEKFVAKLTSKNYHLSTGFLGTPLLLPALTSIGRSDLAYKVLLNEDYPSWGYEIAKGATTMWERWDSIRPDGSFNDPNMNSFNHYAYGAVGHWMYQNIAGISAVEPGYKKSKIAPVVGGGLTSGEGEFASVYGTISSKWKKTGDDLTFDIDVPVNTTSQVSIPAGNLIAVTEGSTLLADADGVSDVAFADGLATFTVGSGSYGFAVSAARARLGDILAEIEKTDEHAGELEQSGDLTADHRARLGAGLNSAGDDVRAASAADGAGDQDQVAQHLSEGLAQIRELTSWLADSSVDGPVKGELSKRLEKIETLFGRGVASSLGVTVVIPPVADSTGPGRTVAGTVQIANGGAVPLDDIEAKVTVADWSDQPATMTRESLAAGETAQLPFSVAVPKRQKPGTYDASVVLTFTSRYGTFTVADSTPWVSVDSGVEITDVTSQSPADGSEERATVTATVKNNGDADVSGQLALGLPDGWTAPPASDQITIAPGASKDVTIPLFVGVEAVAGRVALTTAFVDDGVTLASDESSLVVSLPAPPVQSVLDYVDFGDPTSEAAHGLQAHARSGRNSEAGLTRRYADRSFPGSFYSAEVEVTPGQPFLLRNRETFDGAKTKKYNIYVDDLLVRTYELPRAEEGIGTKTYQILIDDPEALDNDGTVRIKYEFPADASGFYDPSIADSWVLPVPDDDLAPLASATVTSNALPGDNGWFRGDASVAVSAQDNRAGAVTIETGEAAGWQPYVAPITISGDGKHELSYRAKDAAGNSTGEKKIAVWIDQTAPMSQLSVKSSAGIENADRAALIFTAQDALSGVASTTFRVDGGPWQVLGEDDSRQVEGFGEHTVEFFSTDVAGNSEPVRSMVVDLADVDGIAAIVAPQVAGWASIGRTLTAKPGTWNTKGLTLQYQWLRDGEAISGATGSSLKLSVADVGRRIQVKVTASKAGLAAVSATSAATARVAKAASKVSVSYSKSTVKKGKKVKLSIKATSTGTVRVYENGKRVKTLKLSKSGKASYSLKLSKKGLRSIKVVYSGNSTFAPATSATKKIRVK